MTDEMRGSDAYIELPIMPLREVVMFPRSIMPLFVGREASIKAIEAAQATYSKQIFLVAQREPELEKPDAQDLSPVGVVSKVLQMLRLPDGPEQARLAREIGVQPLWEDPVTLKELERDGMTRSRVIDAFRQRLGG